MITAVATKLVAALCMIEGARVGPSRRKRAAIPPRAYQTPGTTPFAGLIVVI
ncbi:hypothetical protein [Mesorhizobium sp. M1E.F.Ca.ET.063.01.1.1]|uniref:hypothetical protein n=1 Tax=Mesorhizobium sp. M1E.F.Ca.ET.063.01.1.1 TaxID=2496750 RepID=UPI001AECB016|nr:hypothetical protein [Mesorhizobium sp. M1E.F.Ca.ET.063.01.1.1]